MYPLAPFAVPFAVPFLYLCCHSGFFVFAWVSYTAATLSFFPSTLSSSCSTFGRLCFPFLQASGPLVRPSNRPVLFPAGPAAEAFFFFYPWLGLLTCSLAPRALSLSRFGQHRIVTDEDPGKGPPRRRPSPQTATREIDAHPSRLPSSHSNNTKAPKRKDLPRPCFLAPCLRTTTHSSNSPTRQLYQAVAYTPKTPCPATATRRASELCRDRASHLTKLLPNYRADEPPPKPKPKHSTFHRLRTPRLCLARPKTAGHVCVISKGL